jgi:fatty-acyl-CoA synthase
MTDRAVRFVDVVALHARYLGAKPALVDGGSVTTYAELWSTAERVAGRLVAAGVRTGQPVVVAAGPSAEHVGALVGIMASGAVACPVNTRLTPLEVREYVTPFAPQHAVVDASNTSLLDGAGARRHDLEDLVGGDGDGRRSCRPVPETEPAITFGTGGTTGLPKAAVWTHRSLALALASSCHHLAFTRSDVELYFSPFFHLTLVTGIFSTLYAGGTVELLRRADPNAIAAALGTGRITRFFGTPTALTRTIDAPGFGAVDTSSVRAAVFGAAPSTAGFVEKLAAAFPAAGVYTGYGATEFGAVTRAYPDELRGCVDPGVGRPVAGVEIRVVDPDGHDVDPGTTGQVVVRSPWQMEGYWGSPAPAAPIRSGDLGTFDDRGYLSIVGRATDTIITGGENVYPLEVERVIGAHCDVVDVAVYGCDDDLWGERVEAAVVVAPGAAVGPDQLTDLCRQRLAGYKVPKRFRFVTALPYTPNLKLDRRALRAEARRADA